MRLKTTFALALSLSLVLLMTGCKVSYPVAQQSGKEDVGYLLLIGNKEYAKKTVSVYLDNEPPFQVKVIKAKDSNRKGTAYTIATGRRSIKVEYNGQIIYSKELFVSTQETKQIILP